MSKWYLNVLKDLFSPIEIGENAKKMSEFAENFDEKIFELILSANKEFYGKFFPHIKTQTDWDIQFEKEWKEYLNCRRDGRGQDITDENDFNRRFAICLGIKDRIKNGENSSKNTFRKMYNYKAQTLKIKRYKRFEKRNRRAWCQFYKENPLEFKQIYYRELEFQKYLQTL